ncbi:hypothetical protein ILUMI_27437 [Ignelater luminosus]|uniref:RNA-directed DNA polymerase n=1 Tax=Ignelater luminosus TaxID=2038154 RepID=A0A8K0C571_IGNLU|nr:hypothetical protein ILUMI_27437 [Ignelater luminosus]
MVIIPKPVGFPIPTFDDIVPQLRQGKVFSRSDIKDAFYQIELAPESTDVTTFIAPKGLYRFKRLMFDITHLATTTELLRRLIRQDIHFKWTQETERAFEKIEKAVSYTKRFPQKMGNIPLRKTRIVVPESLRQLVLKLGHEGHPGIAKLQGTLRTKVWWPKMNQAVEKFVQHCHGCQLVSKPDPSEPIYRTPLPKAPWDYICIDYLGPLPTGDHILRSRNRLLQLLR